MTIYTFTIYPTPSFNFSLLRQFSEEHGVDFRIADPSKIVFTSDNLYRLEEAFEQLSSLPCERISILK